MNLPPENDLGDVAFLCDNLHFEVLGAIDISTHWLYTDGRFPAPFRFPLLSIDFFF